MLIPYWIQKADLSHEDFEAVDYKQAQLAFKTFDWRKEIQIQNDLKKSGKENCDPGIGFVSGDGRILHICPDVNGRAYYCYNFVESRRFLGIIPYKSNQIVSRRNIIEFDLTEVIRRFFLGDHEWLLKNSSETV